MAKDGQSKLTALTGQWMGSLGALFISTQHYHLSRIDWNRQPSLGIAGLVDNQDA